MADFVPRQFSLQGSSFPMEPWAAELVSKLNQFVRETVDAIRIIQMKAAAPAAASTVVVESTPAVIPSFAPFTLANVGSSPNPKAATLSGAAVLALQPADGSNPGVVTAGAQTLGGAKTFTGAISASNLSGTNTGDVTLAAVGSSPSANGATLSGQALTLQPADSTHPGLVTTGAQTLAGAKTFTSNISAPNISGTNTGDVTLTTIGAVPNANGASLSGQVLNLQPASQSFGGVVTTSTQQFFGQKEFYNTGSGATFFYSNDSSGNYLQVGFVNTGGASGIAGCAFNHNNNWVANLIAYGANSFGLAKGLTVDLPSPSTDFGIRIQGTQRLNVTAAGVTATNLLGTNTGDLTLTTVGSSPNANGLSLSGQQLRGQPADASNPGMMSTGAQTLSGEKTFQNTAGVALIASGDPTSPARAPFRIDPQDTAPTGPNAMGDMYVDSATGDVYVCTAAGTPGTWTKIGSQ